jgi:hypothetical protein
MQNLLIFAKLLQGFAHGNVFPERLKKALRFAGPRTSPRHSKQAKEQERDAVQCHSRPVAMVVIARVSLPAAQVSLFFAACPATFARARQSFLRFSHAASASPAFTAGSAGL